ncbi:MAG: hypothetical protein K9M45_02525 [Kiritimatiellales bacterium]|nr:hypothetical protein [Kiritimatiellales bacterium]
MRPEKYRERWNCLKESGGAAAGHLGRQVALSFLDCYLYNDRYEQEYIEILCEMATAEDPETAHVASSALFGIVVEGICDDFEELQTITYNRLMSQIISFCRNRPEGAEMDRELRRFGIADVETLYGRIERLRADSDGFRLKLETACKVIVLSRITIGADVAVTSSIIQRVCTALPEAEVVVIGNAKLNQIIGGNPGIRLHAVAYPRRGGLFDRFQSWFAVLAAIRAEMDDEPDTVVIDPDSRLSQLGVLPLIDDDRYYFFNTRAWSAYPPKISMSEMSNHWMDNVLGEGAYAHPQVWLAPSVVENAKSAVGTLREGGCNSVVAVNMGVGGNARKRVSTGFEEKLLEALLKEPDTVVLLDRGFGEEELAASQHLMDTVKAHGIAVADANLGSLPALKSGMIGIKLELDEVAALISQSDLFIGYDSACQHIAAALGVPCRTVFAGTNNPRFVRRWRACGGGDTELFHVDTITSPRHFDDEDIIERMF